MQSDQPRVPARELWHFACALYASGSVKDLCLHLQDKHGASVDIVLWLCWLHQRGRSAPECLLNEALDLTGGVSQQMLSSLRDIRGAKLRRSGYTAEQQQEVRSRVLAAELAIEAVLLEQLQQLTNLSALPSRGAALGVLDYLRGLCADEAELLERQLLVEVDQLQCKSDS